MLVAFTTYILVDKLFGEACPPEERKGNIR
jgi:hypothetical protein